MKRFLAIAAVALLPACSTISADATKAENAINKEVAKADSFVATKIAPSVDKANAAVVNAVGPYLSKAAHWFFCNKYAQRAYDASEAKNQPACGA